MAVVINEFEVEMQPEAPASTVATDAPPPALPASAHEIERALQQQAERQARIYAH